MKKVSSVNIGGLVFQIDSEAYGKLEAYISALENQFSSTEGSDEIIGDIEYRIAEIFQEKVKRGQESIRAKDIEEVIQIMGAPKDLEHEESTVHTQPVPEPEPVQAAAPAEEPAVEAPQEEPASSKGHKRQHRQSKKEKYYGTRRLFRNREDKVLGGVCSGIGAYVDMDPLIIRLVFIIGVLAFGLSPVVYLVLWVLIPEAKTSSDKLQMRGEKVNIETIEKTIKKEAKELKKRIENLSGKSDEIIDKAEKSADDFFVETGDSFRRMFRGGTKIIIGLLISVILISVFISIIGALFGGLGMAYEFGNYGGYLFSAGWQGPLAGMGLAAVVLIPMLALLFKLIKSLFGLKMNTKPLDAFLFFGWMLGLGLVIAVTAKVATEFQKEVSFSQSSVISEQQQEPVKLSLDTYSPRDYYIMKISDVEVYEDDVIFQNVNLHIGQAENSEYTVETVQHSKGKNRRQATENAKAITYPMDKAGSTINLPDYYRISGSTWRDQELDVYVHVPQGGELLIDHRLHKLLREVDLSDQTSLTEIFDTPLVMQESGLALQ